MADASARIAAVARFPLTRAAAEALCDGSGGASQGGIPGGVVAGTRIATQAGEVAAEELRAGDILSSGHRVAAIGRRTLDVDALARDADARPVRIEAGAIGDGVPRRPLLLAPAQRVVIDGDAVPASALVNGASVTRQRPEREVTYVRVRLDAPGCFAAEGLACDGFRGRGGDAADIARIRGGIDARAGLERGALDGDPAAVDRHGAYGWALDAAHPTAPVALEFVVDGAVVAQAVAEVRRPDLEMAGLGEGRCGFRIRLRHPLPGDGPVIVELRRAGDGAPLPRTPVLLVEAAAGPAKLAAALGQEGEAAANDASPLAAFLAHAVQRLLATRTERPRRASRC